MLFLVKVSDTKRILSNMQISYDFKEWPKYFEYLKLSSSSPISIENFSIYFKRSVTNAVLAVKRAPFLPNQPFGTISFDRII